jgi:hypothetical protein
MLAARTLVLSFPPFQLKASKQFGDMVWRTMKDMSANISQLEDMLKEISAVRSAKT